MYQKTFAKIAVQKSSKGVLVKTYMGINNHRTYANIYVIGSDF